MGGFSGTQPLLKICPGSCKHRDVQECWTIPTETKFPRDALKRQTLLSITGGWTGKSHPPPQHLLLRARAAIGVTSGEKAQALPGQG